MTVPKIAGPKIAGPRNYGMAYFWPGLPPLWIRGSWVGLLVAVGFTALANGLLLASWVFSEWLTLETRLIGYGALVVVWLLARWQSRAERQVNHLATTDEARTNEAGTNEAITNETRTERPPAERDLLFREAQGHYLANDWVATEQVLLKLLKQDARDVESRLMLATLWRHQGRGVEALRQLDRLERLEAASKWQYEIAAERMAIAETMDGGANENEKDDNKAGDHVSAVSPKRTAPPITNDGTESHDDQSRAA